MTRRRRIRRRRYEKACSTCSAPFTATRRDARFCSAACRKRESRSKPPLTRDSSVTVDAPTVTQFERNVATAEAYLEWRREHHPRLEDME